MTLAHQRGGLYFRCGLKRASHPIPSHSAVLRSRRRSANNKPPSKHIKALRTNMLCITHMKSDFNALCDSVLLMMIVCLPHICNAIKLPGHRASWYLHFLGPLHLLMQDCASPWTTPYLTRNGTSSTQTVPRAYPARPAANGEACRWGSISSFIFTRMNG